ncbi:MAG: hypothetical protein V1800_10430 [Candidatus Latescibacterota bacterium]
MKVGIVLLVGMIGAALMGALAAQETPDFATEILPIFTYNCLSCHEFAASYQQVMAMTSGGVAVVVPGDAAESILIWRVEGKKADGSALTRMPYFKNALPVATIQLLKDWINAGALEEIPVAMPSRSWGKIKATF